RRPPVLSSPKIYARFSATSAPSHTSRVTSRHSSDATVRVQKGSATMNRTLRQLLKVSAATAAVLALSARAELRAHPQNTRHVGEDGDDRGGSDGDDQGHWHGGLQLATGQFVTPTAVKGAVQQFLNPGLADYPNFIAGEAVRSRLSPDGTT